jgi:hypothetical protein
MERRNPVNRGTVSEKFSAQLMSACMTGRNL